MRRTCIGIYGANEVQCHEDEPQGQRNPFLTKNTTFGIVPLYPFTSRLLGIQEILSHDIPIRLNTATNDIKYDDDRWGVSKNLPMVLR